MSALVSRTGFARFDRSSLPDQAPPRIQALPARDERPDDQPTASKPLIGTNMARVGNQTNPTVRKEVIVMSEGCRTVDIRAGPATLGDRPELDQMPASDASEPDAAREWADDGAEGRPAGAAVPAGTGFKDRMIPLGWFG
jgi:hypothetical protein